MYNPYFRFSCSPFENTLDQRFLFFSECHDEVIEALLYFVKEKKSFALVCGDVGTGKTMIVHHLLGNLPGSVKPILIPYPDVEYAEILRYIARVLEINPEGKEVLGLADEVRAVLKEASLSGKQVILIIDEAHLLSIKSLEDIRLLSNIEVTEHNLLQILLIGQNELSHKLHRRDMRQLRQRISVNRFLSPMSASETIAYVDHRLRVVGSSFDKCFVSACKDLIFKMTDGVPRNINRLCDTALLVCMTEKRDTVTGRMLKKAHDALQTDVILVPKDSKSKSFDAREGDNEFGEKKSGLNRLNPAFAGVVVLFILALVALGYWGNLGENLKARLYGPGPAKAVVTNIEKSLPPASESVERNSKDTGVSVKDAAVSRETTSKPAAAEQGPSTTMPAPVITQGPDSDPGPVASPPKGSEQAGNVDENVVKIDAAAPSVEGQGPTPAPMETEAKEPKANGEAAQVEVGDCCAGDCRKG